MKPDKRYGAFIILSMVFLAVFLFSSSRSSIHHGAVPGGNALALRTPSVPPENTTGKAVSENKRPVEPAPLKEEFPVFPVDINAAGAEELMLLPGIGEKTAQRIIEKRKELGGFQTVDELTEVKWIGPAKLARIRNLVTVNSGRDRGENARPAGG